MFPAIEKELAKNNFFKAWKDNSVFEKLLGTPPILIKELSEKWVENFKTLIGDGPMTYRYLVNLADYIEKIQYLEGYSFIRKRLLRLDEQLHPTLVEIEFMWFLLLKTPIEKMHGEFTFEVSTGKNPELMVDTPSGPVYFEVTSVENYKLMNTLLQYFNTFTAFQLSLKVLYGINRRLKVSFMQYPTENILQCVYRDINDYVSKKQFIFKKIESTHEIEMTEGIEVAFNFPQADIINKIKDKIEEKSAF